MSRRRSDRCTYVTPWFTDCAAATDWAVSARHTSGSEWVPYPVCSEHVDTLRDELASLGLFERVSEAYDTRTAGARQQLERLAAARPPYRPGEVWRWTLCEFGGAAHDVDVRDAEVTSTYAGGFRLAGVCRACGTPCVNVSEIGPRAVAAPWWQA